MTGGFTANHGGPAIDACVAGLGFGYFLSYQVAPAVREGHLQVILEEFETPALPVNLVYPGGRLMSSRLRAFLDWMKEHLRLGSTER